MEEQDELDITTLHIGQLIQVKQTKEVVKITGISGISNMIDTYPYTDFSLIKDFQEIPKPQNAFGWLSNIAMEKQKSMGFILQQKRRTILQF